MNKAACPSEKPGLFQDRTRRRFHDIAVETSRRIYEKKQLGAFQPGEYEKAVDVWTRLVSTADELLNLVAN